MPLSLPSPPQIKATGRAETCLQAVADRYARTVAAAPGETAAPPRRLLGMAMHLGALRVTLCDSGAARWCMRIAMNVPGEDAIYVVKCDQSLKWLHGLL